MLHHKELRDNVLESKLEVFDQGYADIFVDESSELNQAGKLKLEGQYSGGRFRGIKCYGLRDLGEESLGERRMKGISHSVQKALEWKHLDPTDGYGQTPIASQWSLRPSPNLSVGLSIKSRILPTAINYKRQCLVSSLSPTPLF